MSSHAFVLRWLIILSFTAFAIYIVYNVSNSLSIETVEVGFEKIKANPWALSALFDYIASLPISAVFVATRITTNPLISIIAATAVTCLGNPILLLVAAYYLLNAKTCREAWLLPSHDVNAHQNPYGVIAFRLAILLNLVVYIWSVGRALFLESPSEGWANITSNPWSYTTFIDSFAGVMFSIIYIVAKEWGRPLVWVPFVFGLLLGGNGVGCVYIFLASIAETSIRSSILSAHPISISSAQREYQPIP
ncbi:hypothetical protein HDU97_006750 [Phlyctochytrium planicorne]|nr:hypothetical protein HDU97_006750 [Phlyctochytrium planicorne]